jgi:membrane-associated phospholipid phosphatase
MKHGILALSLGLGTLFLSFSLPSRADDTLCLRRRRDFLLLGGGATLFALGTYFCSRMDPPDMAKLDREKIFIVDRFAVNFSCESTAFASDVTCGVCMGIPLVLALSSCNWQTICQDFLMYTESMLFAQGVAQLSKAIFQRPCPYAYTIAESQTHYLTGEAGRSFFSGHTAAAFCGAVFAGTVFQRRYPESPWVKPLWILGLTTATTTAVLRVTSGNHFPTDVIVGAFVGSLTGWFIPRLYRCKREEKGLSIVMGEGMGVQLSF